ncbi:hypothetical protein ACX1NX_01710 [Acinetobacter sp. ANC 5383]
MPNKFSFQDFINESSKNNNSSTAVAPISSALETSLSTLDLFKGDQKKVKEFKDGINSDLTSPQTLGDISNLIGEPKLNETEDEFVKRSMDSLTDYLTKKFCK